MKNICVFGSVSDKINPIYIEYAEELGKEISSRKYNLIFGGVKNGILGGLAKGFLSNKTSKIIAVMPEFFQYEKGNEVLYECDEIIYTKDVTNRKEKFKEKADAIIILPGGIGTLDEFFDVACSKRWGYYNIPVIIYNINHYYDKLIAVLNYSIKENFGKENYNETYKIFDNIDDIFEYINNY